MRWGDPRSSSTQSLVPTDSEFRGGSGPGSGSKRRLLLIYIHGFYGNTQSFNSFPAHLHAYLKEALSDTHAIHTKIYPRYKTYRAIGVGAENFSKWLEPHEDESTDVILVGHSMGGILAAEIVLLPNPNPFDPHLYKHHILGILAMDAPFLGLHPGVVPSGIASLFRRDEMPEPQGTNTTQTGSAPELTPESSTVTTSSTGETPPPASGPATTLDPAVGPPGTSVSPNPISPPPHHSDPTFDPPWHNDVVREERSTLTALAHFTKKHLSEGIFTAAGRHILSHMEYGSSLADYRQLHARYNEVRRLEDVVPGPPPQEGPGPAEPSFRARAARVRFVNYYTSATGRPKKEKVKKKERTESTGNVAEGASTPRISVELHEEGSEASSAPHGSSQPPSYEAAMGLTDEKSSSAAPSYPSSQPLAQSELPFRPPPTPPSPALTPTTSTSTAASTSGGGGGGGFSKKEAFQSAYDMALKASRKKLLKHAFKLLEKREQHSTSAPSPADPDLHLYDGPVTPPQTITPLQSPPPPPPPRPEPTLPTKMRKFCATPKRAGRIDSAWVSVPMRDIDEVEAHVSMFLSGNAHYESLVADAGARVVGWVRGET
ncbi:uncharacterized protein DNG_03471 [Cephalotrichum gorgonifer]|uniref:GPI inositol-deacylase n=1 Tax=Cephalotrichum gorgonifer TaxID=2041049 RepID=A0AAE8MV70_9PEZI|nr:uncharacterized protein DNG_03471 [Cephalotrichum gorgonifer]